MITIRKAIADDKLTIQKLNNNADVRQFCLDCLPEHTMVVELEDTLVGYGSLDIADELAIIRGVYIAHNYRNQGLGDGLVRALINYADRRAVKRIYIFSDREIDYFKRFGFKYISSDQCDIKIVGAYNTNSDDYSYIMELDIDEYFNSRHCH